MSVLDRLYMASPIGVQNALISAYGLVLYSRRMGREHNRLVKEVASWENCSIDDLRRRESDLIQRTIASAAQRVPYYRNLFRRHHIDPIGIASKEHLADLPLLDKDIVREQPTQFYAEGVDARLSISTSGSSGSPLTVRCTHEALRRNYAHFYRLRERLGIGKRDRCATFAGRAIVPTNASEPPFWRYNWATNTLLFSTYHMTPKHMSAYVNRLRRFSPALIDSYPSALGLLASYASENSPGITPRAILTSSETLSASQRTLVENAFSCKVTDQYGSAEMVAFVAQCEHGTYHVWPSFGTVELLVAGRAALPGETGELVCTGHINPAMPLLRYRTGDLAVAGDGCSCGSPFQAIVRIEGRMDDIIITPDGRRVGRLDPVFKGVPDNAFVEAQIVQETSERIVLRYVKGSRYAEEALTRVRENLQKRLGPRMHIDTEETAALPRGRNGKLKAVWNKTVHTDNGTREGVGRQESRPRVSSDKG